MTPASTTRLPELLTKHEGPILERWVEEQLATIGPKRGLMSDAEMREQSREFLGLVRQAAQTGEADIEGAPWTAVRDFLGRISASRAVQGFSPAETAVFVFSLKQPVFEQLRRDGGSTEGLFDEVWRTSLLIDRLGLYTTEVYQKGRERLILRQRGDVAGHRKVGIGALPDRGPVVPGFDGRG